MENISQSIKSKLWQATGAYMSDYPMTKAQRAVWDKAWLFFRVPRCIPTHAKLETSIALFVRHRVEGQNFMSIRRDLRGA